MEITKSSNSKAFFPLSTAVTATAQHIFNKHLIRVRVMWKCLSTSSIVRRFKISPVIAVLYIGFNLVVKLYSNQNKQKKREKLRAPFQNSPYLSGLKKIKKIS